MTTPGTSPAQAGATRSKPATITTWNHFAENIQLSLADEALGACRRIPSSARERAIFSPGKDGEAGDVGSIVDAARWKKGRSKPDRILRQAPRFGPSLHGGNYYALC